MARTTGAAAARRAQRYADEAHAAARGVEGTDRHGTVCTWAQRAQVAAWHAKRCAEARDAQGAGWYSQNAWAAAQTAAIAARQPRAD